MARGGGTHHSTPATPVARAHSFPSLAVGTMVHTPIGVNTFCKSFKPATSEEMATLDTQAAAESFVTASSALLASACRMPSALPGAAVRHLPESVFASKSVGMPIPCYHVIPM